MSLLETAWVAARDRKRLADIMRVLANFGLDDLFTRLGLAGLLTREANSRSPQNQEPAPVRLRLAIETLGATFIKLGQILSTRGDLLAPEWISELEKLQSQVPALPWEAIKTQIEQDLGAPINEVFSQFNQEPLAAGSIAQVYRARLREGDATHSGDEVIVKVRRPGLGPLIEADLRLLGHIAALAEQQWAQLARYRMQDVLQHLGAAMAEELDFLTEARNSEIIAAHFHTNPYIKIPRVYSAFTSEGLMVQEYIDGIEPKNSAVITAAGLNGKLLAERGAQGFLHSMLLGGIFHADPHPGNLRALQGNRVAFIDFGMVGRLGARRREQLLVFFAVKRIV